MVIGDEAREHPNCANVSYKQGSRGAGEQGSRGENRFKFSYIPVHQNIFAKTGCTPIHLELGVGNL